MEVLYERSPITKGTPLLYSKRRNHFRHKAFLLITIVAISAIVISSSNPIQPAFATVTKVQQTAGAAAAPASSKNTCTLASASTHGNLIIIAFTGYYGTGTAPTVTSITDTASSSWTDMSGGGKTSGGSVGVKTWVYAATLAASEGVSGEVITINWGTSPTETYLTCSEWSGILSPTVTTKTNSGTTTTSPLSASVASFTPTSGDLVYSFAGYTTCASTGTITYNSGYTSQTAKGTDFATADTCINSGSVKFQLNAADESNSAISSATTSTFSIVSGSNPAQSRNMGWTEVTAEFKFAVTQPVKLTVDNSGTTGTFTVSGCGVDPAANTIAGDNVAHNLNVAWTCAATITVPSDATNTRDRFSGPATSVTLSNSCTSGTCTEIDKTYYYQLQNTPQASTNGVGPPNWAASTSTSIVQHTSNAGTSDPNSKAFGSNVGTNDMLVATLELSSANSKLPSVSDTLGLVWTQANNTLSTNGQAFMWYAFTGSSSGADTVTVSGQTALNNKLDIFELSGVGIPVTHKATGTGTNVALTQSLSYTAGSILIGAVGFTGTTMTAGTNFALSDTSTSSDGGSAEQSTTASSPNTFPATLGTSQTWGEIGAVFPPGLVIIPTSTIAGTASSNVCYIFPTSGTTTTASQTSGCWTDYNRAVTAPSTVINQASNEQFKLYGTSSYTPTTGGNTETAFTYYRQESNTWGCNPAAPTTWDGIFFCTVSGTAGGSNGTLVQQNSGTAAFYGVCNNSGANCLSVTAVGEHVNSGSALVNKIVYQETLGLFKSGAPTGTATACVLDSSANCKFTFGTVDVSTLTTTAAATTFTASSGYNITSGDYIGIKYSGGDNSNFLKVVKVSSNQYDGTNSASATFAGSWSADKTEDLGGSGTGNPWILTGAGTLLCDLATSNGGGSVTCSSIFTDYNTPVLTPVSFNTGEWQTGTSAPSPTTGGNTNTLNYLAKLTQTLTNTVALAFADSVNYAQTLTNTVTLAFADTQGSLTEVTHHDYPIVGQIYASSSGSNGLHALKYREWQPASYGPITSWSSNTQPFSTTGSSLGEMSSNPFGQAALWIEGSSPYTTKYASQNQTSTAVWASTSVIATDSPQYNDYGTDDHRIFNVGGKLFAFAFNSTANNIVYKVSSDRGATWGAETTVGTGTGTIGGDLSNFAIMAVTVSGTNYIDVVYYGTGTGSLAFKSFRGSVSGATITWDTSVTAFSQTITSTATATTMDVDSNNNLWLASRFYNSGYTYRIDESTDGGHSWSNKVSATAAVDPSGVRLAMALASTGNGKMVFMYVAGLGSEFTYRTFDGTSWSSELTTSGSGMGTSGARQIAAATDQNNNAYFFYIAGAPPAHLQVATFDSNNKFLGFTTVDNTATHYQPSASVDAGGGVHVYTIDSTDTLIYDNYGVPKEGAWSSETELPSIRATAHEIEYSKLLVNPVTGQRVAIEADDNSDLDLFYCDNSCTTAANWNGYYEFTSALKTHTLGNGVRNWDCAYEGDNGLLVCVYNNNAGTNYLQFRTWDGSAHVISSESTVAMSALSGEQLKWVSMAPKPTSGSPEITLVTSDSTNLRSDAWIWSSNNSTFSNHLALTSASTSTTQQFDAIGVAYETSSGSAVVFSGIAADTSCWARWTASGGWSNCASTDPDAAASNQVQWVSMKADPDPSSNKIMICQSDSVSGMSCAEENNGALGSWTRHTTAIYQTTTRPFDFVYDDFKSTGLLVYGTTIAGQVNTRTWTSSSSTWGTVTASDYVGNEAWISLATATSGQNGRSTLGSIVNSNDQIGGILYDDRNSFQSLGSQTFTLTGNSASVEESANILYISPGMLQAWNSPATPFGTTFTGSSANNLAATRGLASVTFQNNAGTSMNFTSYSATTPNTISTSSVSASSPGTGLLFTNDAHRSVQSGNYIFAFWYNGSSGINYASSGDGVTWSSSATVTGVNVPSDTQNNQISWNVIAQVVSSTDYVDIVYGTGSGSSWTVNSMRGVVSGNTITWDSTVVVVSLPSTTKPDVSPAMAIGTDGKLWVATKTLITSTPIWQYRVDYSTDAGHTWTQSIGQTDRAHSPGNFEYSIGIGTTANGKAVLLYAPYDFNEFVYRTFDGSSWGAELTTSGSGMTTSSYKQFSVDSDASKKLYFAFISGQPSANSKGSLSVGTFNSDNTFSSFTTLDSIHQQNTPSVSFVQVTNITGSYAGQIHVFSMQNSNGQIYDTIFAGAGTRSNEVSFSVTKSLSQTIHNAVAIAKFNIVKVLTDAIHFVDTLATQFSPGGNSFSQTLTETMTNTLSLFFTTTKVLSDSQTVSSTTTSFSDSLGAFTETVTNTEGTDVFSFTKGLAQTLTNTVALIFSTTKVLSDTQTISNDAVSHVWTATESLSDSITNTITIAKFDVTKVLADTQTISNDVLSHTWTASLTLSQTVNNAVTVFFSVTKVLADSITNSDTVVHVWIATETMSETITNTPGITFSVIKVLADSVTNSDVLTHVWTATESLAESMTNAGAIKFSVIKVLSDAQTISNDAISHVWTATISLSESISNTVTVFFTVVKALSEATSISDTVTHVWSVTESLSESITNTPTISFSVIKVLADSMTNTDVVSHVWTATESLTESITNTIAIFFSDTKGLADSVNNAIAISQFTVTSVHTDSVTNTDTIVKDFTKVNADSISISAAVTAAVAFAVTLNETMSVADTRTMSVAKEQDELTTFIATIANAVNKGTFTESMASSTSLSFTTNPTESDSVTITTTMQGFSITKSLSESMNTAATETNSITKVLTDTLHIVDTETNVFTSNENLSESTNVSPAIRFDVTKSLSDSMTSSDAVSHTWTATLSLSENMATSASVTFSVTKVLSDTQTISNDAISHVWSANEALSENIATSATPTFSTTKSESDTLHMSDTMSSTFNANENPSESTTITPSTTFSVTKVLSDSITHTDSVTHSWTASITLTESMTSVATESNSVTKVLSDAQTVSNDVLTHTWTANEALSESMSMSQSQTFSVSKALSQTVTSSDSISFTASNSESETETFTDSQSKTIGKNLFDSVTSAANVTAFISSTHYSETLNETITNTDTVTKSVTKVESDSQTVSSDTMSLSVSKSLADSVSASESATFTVVKSDSESVTITTTMSGFSITKSLSESMSTSATESNSVTKVLSDSISTSASPTFTLTNSDNESVTITTTMQGFSITKVLTEAMTTTDSESNSFTKVLTDNIHMTDSVSTAFTATRTLSESISSSDSVIFSVTKSESDSQTSSDAVAFSDSKALSESVNTATSTTLTFNSSESDSVTITTTMQGFSITKSLSDSMTSSATESNSVTKILADSIHATDSVTFSLSHSSTDSVTFNATMQGFSITKTLAESMLTSESPTFSVTKGLSDSQHMADSVTFSFSHTFSESIHSSDAISFVVVKSDSESMTTSDAKSFDITKNLSDSIHMATSETNTLSKEDDESVTITTTMQGFSITKRLSESITMSASPVFDDSQSDSESMSTSDTVEFSTVKNLSDSVSMSTSMSSTVTGSRSETLTITSTMTGFDITKSESDTQHMTDAKSFDFQKNLAESMTFTDKVAVGTFLNENVTITDNNTLDIEKALDEHVSIGDSLTLVLTQTGTSPPPPISYFLYLNEGVHMADNLTTFNGPAIQANLVESMHSSDSISKDVEHIVQQGQHIDDGTVTATKGFGLTLSETIHIVTNIFGNLVHTHNVVSGDTGCDFPIFDTGICM